MPGQHCCVVRQRVETALYCGDECVVIGRGEIGAPDRTGEERIT